MITISEQPNEIENLMPAPYVMAVETLSPAAAAQMLEQARTGGQPDEVVIAQYRGAMQSGRWSLNGMPIIISRQGVLLDGVQRLHACIAEGRPLQSFVARGVDDAVLPTIDQHIRRTSRDILAARGAAHPRAMAALITRLIRYEEALGLRAITAVPTWPQIEDILFACPELEETLAESLRMSGSPLPEPIRTAILCIGLQHNRAKTLRLLQAVWRPHRFDVGEPGAALRLEIDRDLPAGHRTPAARERLFAIALLALQATIEDRKLRQITWHDGTEPGKPRDPLPDLRANWMLRARMEGRLTALPMPAMPGVSFESIGPTQAAAYLKQSPAVGEVNKAHLDALTRDIVARRWMANPQPICFSASGRLVNGRHRLMAVMAAHLPIAVSVVRGVAEDAYATYDLQKKRAPQVSTLGPAFGDEALVAAMANLLWREERRRPNTQSRTATAAEIQQILADYPRLRELRGLARRMVGMARASVIGYFAFVVERDNPALASVFLNGLETGADLPRGHPILALRTTLLRLRGESASQEQQMAALLDGWRRFKLHAAEAGRGGPQRAAPANHTARPPNPDVDSQAASAIAELQRRKQQQAITAAFSRFVMSRPSEQALMQETARVAAHGLGAGYSKVLQYEPQTSSLMLRAGIGWPVEAIGNTSFALGSGSPAGLAFTSGRAIFSDNISADQRFSLPPLFKAHGIIRQVNVVIGGEGAPFGVLEVDDTTPGQYDGSDISFLAALANSLGLALELARDSAERDRLLLGRAAAMADLQHRMRNSLQLVHTVLTLQADDAEDDAARKLLESSAQRIITIGMVTEQIHQTGQQEAVELCSYLKGLVGAVQDGLAELAEGRSIAVDAASSRVWPAKRAELLGIVMAELLTNALQYGRGAVQVRFFDAASTARLEVSNDDHSPPSAPAAGQASGAGMRIAAALLREHGGALTVHQTSRAVQVVAEFPWTAASRPGSQRSSASRKPIQSPRAIPRPWLRALAGPALAPSRHSLIRAPPRVSSVMARSVPVWVLPSSTRMNSPCRPTASISSSAEATAARNKPGSASITGHITLMSMPKPPSTASHYQYK